MRTSTSILKDTSSALVNLNPDPKSSLVDDGHGASQEDEKTSDNSKKKEKKKKRGKSDEKKKDTVHSHHNCLSSSTNTSSHVTNKSEKLLPNSVNISFPLNLSTEESGYESDLTRKTSSKVNLKTYSSLIYF